MKLLVHLRSVMLHFQVIGIFNEADTHESTSILIYSKLQMGLYTQLGWQEAVLIKR